MFGLSLGLSVLLVFLLICAFAFEFINGFHDTANAVATVIYTHSLKPRLAVIWSGICNFLGVLTGGIAVAMGIVNLLPMEALTDLSITHNIALILALILTAIIWNLGTWYYGIPCSSSHTLIGSIFGVGIALMLMPDGQNIVLNWKKVEDVGLSLLISPFFGFALAMFFLLLLKITVKRKVLFRPPRLKKSPPLWIRSIIILTSTGVSFSHGSNDGQKGVGLVMIILISIAPAWFALDKSKDKSQIINNVNRIELVINKINPVSLNVENRGNLATLKHEIEHIKINLAKPNSDDKVNFEIKKNIMLINKMSEKIITKNTAAIDPNITKSDIKYVKKDVGILKSYVEYSPMWVIVMISFALGIGTMIGWKRVVLTIGEKIGKTQLTYAQGVSAQLIAASTIGVSTWLGLPVSTTHVLSSGIAGTMVASDGVKNIQGGTIKNIAIAWIVTLPVTIILSGGIFILLRWILG